MNTYDHFHGHAALVGYVLASYVFDLKLTTVTMFGKSVPIPFFFPPLGLTTFIYFGIPTGESRVR